MIDNINAYVDFMIKNKISTNQFLLLYLLHSENYSKSKDGLKYKSIGNIYKWSECASETIKTPTGTKNNPKFIKNSGWTDLEIDDLINKEFIFGIKSKQLNGHYTYSIDQLFLTQKFSDVMFINSNFAFEEILEMYPDTFNINNQVVFTKSGDLDKVANDYFKLTKGSIIKHDEIKEIIIYAKERGLCNYKLENFLSRGVIDTIKKMMGESYDKGKDI